MQDNDAATKLMTVLNVSAAHPRNIKRARDPAHDWALLARKARKTALEEAKRKKQAEQAQAAKDKSQGSATASENADQSHQDENTAAADADAFKDHFGAETPLLKASALSAVESKSWSTSAPKSTPGLGLLTDYTLSVPQDVQSLHHEYKLAQNVSLIWTSGRVPRFSHFFIPHTDHLADVVLRYSR